MNKIRETLENSGPRLISLIVICTVSICIVTTSIISNGVTEINDYIETVSIQLSDGNEAIKDYLVLQENVQEVLKKLDISMGEFDELNKPMDYIVNKNDLITITRISQAELIENEQIDYKTITTYDGLNLFSTSVVQEGSYGELEKKYTVSYHNGVENSRELIESNVLTESVDKIVSTGSVQAGAYFTGRLTQYGGDCVGCSGYAASGIQLSPSSGVNGSYTAKLNYNGGSYYALAADSSIPFGTIIEIRNHNYTIESVAYGIVVDRGGAIKGNKIDIFSGSEITGNKYFNGSTTSNVQFKIISVGSGRNFWR